MTDRVADERLDQKADRPYPLLWYLLGALSPRLTIPALRRVIENAGLAGHGIALAIAIAIAFFVGVTIVFIGRIERLVYRFVLALLWVAALFSLWYFTR